MLRVKLDQAHLKRTIRPLYGWTQATPKSAFLSTADNAAHLGVDIFPGYVMTRVAGEEFDVVSGTNPEVDLGLSGLFIGGDGIDEVAEVGVNAIAIWSLGPDAEFEILAPAFIGITGGTSVGTLLHGVESSGTTTAAQGKLAPAGYSADSATLTTKPVAKLIQVVNETTIIIGGLQGAAA